MAAIDTTILSQLQNTLTDLRAAEYNTYERHIKKLSRILHAPELDGISRNLTDGIDLESWLAAGLATRRRSEKYLRLDLDAIGKII